MDTTPTMTEKADDAAAEPPPLRRSSSPRIIAGVAGGIAKRFDIDVNLVRVAFVVLALFWGFGVAVYLAMWALVPAEASPSGIEGEEETSSQHSWWLTALLLAAAVLIGVLFIAPLRGGPRLGAGIGATWVLVLAVLAIVALLRGVGRRSIGRALAVMVLGALSLVIVAVGTAFAVIAMTGVPLAGGVGERVWQPTTSAQVQPSYHTAIGNMTVDLRRVSFPRGVTKVTATVGVGRLLVEVPANVVVDVNAHAGVGTVVYVNGSLQSFSGSASSAHRAQLLLVAEAGIGQVQLYRGAGQPS